MSPRPEDSIAAENEVKPTVPKLVRPAKGEEIVISGSSGSFPDSDSMYMFRDKLMSKSDLVTDDGRRWKSDHPEIPQRTGKLYNIDKFDAGFFGIHSKQATVMDPMMRIAFERVYEAIVDAGVNPASLRGTSTGVFQGTCFNESEKHWFYDDVDMDGLVVTNCSRGSMATRISHWLGLNSVSYVVDTACSSSLYALERAYFSLINGVCDAAIVVGANVCLHPFVSLQFSRLGVLSPDGRCKCFDNDADGYCRSEAIPVVFLQKAKDAKRVYARIVHAKTNCDGFKEHGITFPSRKMQLQLLKDFYEECEIDPTTVSFVEAHGTGTRVGDPEECNSLDEVFCKNRKEPLLIGSVKSNMGHSEPSSGLCSVSKAIITFETGMIPPNLNYKTPRESIPALPEGRLKVVTDPTPLPGNKGLIGINSFGFGGANAHVLLEWNHKTKIRGGLPSDNIPRLVVVSGRHEEAVNVILDDVKSRPLDVEFVQLLNELHSDTLVGHKARGFGIFTTTGEKLRFIQERQSSHTINNDVTFVFPGLGKETIALGKSLMKLPPFAATIDLLSKALSFSEIDLYAILTEEDTSGNDILNTTLSLVACQIGLVDCLASVGVYPANVLGYSIGEIACAYALRNLTAEQAIKTAYFIAKSMLEAEVSNTATIKVGLEKNDVLRYLTSGIEISALSGQNSTTLVGPVNNIRRLKENFVSKGVDVEDVNLSGVGLHSYYVAEIEHRLLGYLKKVIPYPMPRSEKWVSTGASRRFRENVSDRTCSAEYFVRGLLNPVDLKRALIELPNNGVVLNFGPKNWLKDEFCDSSRYIDVFDSAATDACVQFLTSLGMLYLSEVNVAVSNLYPQVQYPVSRSTPMISPLIRWDHHKNWYTVRFDDTDSRLGGEKKFIVSLRSEDYRYITGHMIDGRVLFPATGYVKLVIDVMSIFSGDMSNELTVVLEDVNLIRATPITENNHEFTISFEKSTGNFEILEGGALVVTGRASWPGDNSDSELADPSVLVHREKPGAKNIVLSKKDIYKELRLRGYNYTGLFRGLNNVEPAKGVGMVEWTGNWVSFMDTMLQIQILGIPNRDLLVPTYIGKIIYDPVAHINAVKNCKTENTVVELPIHFYEDVNVIKAGGIEIWNLRAQQIPRRKPMEDAVLEKYSFTPHNLSLSEDDSLLKTTRVFVHLALENLPGVKVKVLELADEALPGETALIAPLVSTVLADLPLIQADVRVVALPDSHHGKNAENFVAVDEKALKTEKDCSIIVGADLLARPEVLAQIRGSLKETGFIIAREKVDAATAYPELTVLAEYVVGNEKLVLLRKSVPSSNDIKVVPITNDDEFSWVAPLREALTSTTKLVVVVAQNNDENGILGLVNCVRQEPYGEKIRCVFIRDKEAPLFDIKLPLYAEQLSKNLVLNVYENGTWGTYRHHALPKIEPIRSEHVYINNLVKGDLSSLTLIQGHLHRYIKNLKNMRHVKLAYAALNFRDVMLTAGKIVRPQCLARNDDMEIGFEFSGYNEKGERIMGITPCGSLTTLSNELYDEMTWKVPDHWSLEDAATIPCVYSTVYMALVRCGKAQRGESILIHSAAGGVGISAINVALGMGLEIYATVGGPEKRKFLHDNYPQIPDSHIGCSRDTTFEDMVKRETNNRGVDLVLNSLSDEKMEASLRCLAEKGRFLEIGKYDLLNNVPLAAEPFLKNISYHCIMLDIAMEGNKELQKIVHANMAELMGRSWIKPLPRTVFDFTRPEEAFRYMTTGKHIGKVLLKIRDEKEGPNVPKVFNAVPRYSANPSATYIVLGGLGGFGLELSNWLVSRGARFLVLTSRTGVRNGYQAARVSAWENVGARVLISTADASTEEGAKKLLNDANALAPVGGIYNLAVVLKDSIFENQTEETFRESFEGKAKATKVLDKLTRTMCPDLEDFVVFSSVSCGRGNSGQSNYGMSNSVMERICEKRKAAGLPGLAVQWGAVGDVGLVAEMAESNQQLVIGGTLQQTINSCLQCLDTFLTQDAPVVASMVVAEKRSGRKVAGTMTETVADILGIKDLKTISTNTSLSELGMDSMTAVEIKQTLEREFEVFLTAQDLRGMTFAKLASLDSASSGAVPNTVDLGVNIFIRSVPLQSDAVQKVLLLNNVSSGSQTIFFIPGMDGFSSTFRPVAQTLKYPALALNYPFKNADSTSVKKTAELMLPAVLERLAADGDFKIVGYSAGTLVAIELAQLLEATGRNGHVILVDGSPTVISGILKTLKIGESDDDIANTVLSGIQESMVPGSEKLPFSNVKTWEEKLSLLESTSKNQSMEHSHDYLRDCSYELFIRLKNIVSYKTSLEKPLKSKITLIKPEEPTMTVVNSEDYDLSAWTQQPVQIFTTKGNHTTMWNEENLSIVLNQIL